MARLLVLVLTLAGMGVGLVALAPEHFNRPVADFAYFIGLGFFVAAGMVLVVPLMLRSIRLATEAVPPDLILRAARRRGWTPSNDDRSLFVELLVFLARRVRSFWSGQGLGDPPSPFRLCTLKRTTS